ncbi:aminopeptidase N [Streptacidiphilus sp. PAMC 29251]
MPSLTRAEAVERAALLTVRSYHIRLDLTSDDEVFHSTTTIDFDAVGPAAGTFLDVKPRILRSAVLNGTPLDVADLQDGRLPLSGLAARNQLVVTAEMEYSHEGQGLHRFVDQVDGETYLYAQSFLDAAPRIYACFDQPDLKARYTFDVTVPDHWQVLGTGTAAKVGPGHWQLAETEPLSTYLTALIAGPYRGFHSVHDGIPLGLHCRASIADALAADTEELFGITGRCLDEYHRIFGTRYPFGSYDQVFVPEFNSLAMENPGCVSIRDQYVFRSTPTAGEKEDRALIIAHEMAHMWFGNLVTMRWWDDLWLNEAFADYMGHRLTTELTKYSGALTTFSAARKGLAYAADQRPSTHPVGAEAVDAMAGLALFDRISYFKGSAVLRQLATRIGEEALEAGLHTYVSRHAYGNTTTADFLAALQEQSSTDLTRWAALWLRESNVNTLRAELTVADGLITSAVVHQTAPESHPVLRPHTLRIGLYGEEDTSVLVEVDGARTEVPGLVGLPAPRLLLLNDGDLAYAKIQLDQRSLTALPELLPTLSPLNRAMLWGTLLLAVQDGAFPAADYLDLAQDMAAVETELPIIAEVLQQARTEVADRYLQPAERPAALAGLGRACRALLDRTRPGDERRLLAFRTLVDCGADEAELRAWAAGTGIPDGVALDSELGWRIRYRLAALGGIDAAGIDAAQQADPGAEGEQWAAKCRAALPDPEAKQAAWDLITTAGDLSNYQVWALAEGFWQPDQVELTAPFVERFFAEMPGVGALRGDQVLDMLVRLLYPRYAAAPETLALAEAMLADEGLPLPLRRRTVDFTDDLRHVVTARQQNR